jgi:hypothetical protein
MPMPFASEHSTAAAPPRGATRQLRSGAGLREGFKYVLPFARSGSRRETADETTEIANDTTLDGDES